jgi:cytochrome c-type biogenesis protein CcmH/NrfG
MPNVRPFPAPTKAYSPIVGLRILLMVVICLLAALSVAAQQAQSPAPAAPVSPEDTAAYDAAFQETLRNPADPPTLVKFATLAVKVGDLEGAISALDRLLLIDGDNPDVQLELGVLYFRLGSLEAARTYLDAVRTSRRASAEMKTRAASFLKEASRP